MCGWNADILVLNKAVYHCILQVLEAESTEL